MAESGSNPLIPELLLDNQLCFPLYACSRLITRLYQPILEPLGLTYPQYIVMMILWQQSPCAVSAIGERALLASNTLTPLLKRLEMQGLVTRSRASQDERVVTIALTDAGRALQQGCAAVPGQIFERTGFAEDKARELKRLLDELVPLLSQRMS